NRPAGLPTAFGLVELAMAADARGLLEVEDTEYPQGLLAVDQLDFVTSIWSMRRRARRSRPAHSAGSFTTPSSRARSSSRSAASSSFTSSRIARSLGDAVHRRDPCAARCLAANAAETR